MEKIKLFVADEDLFNKVREELLKKLSEEALAKIFSGKEALGYYEAKQVIENAFSQMKFDYTDKNGLI
jgi:hypothetical protein